MLHAIAAELAGERETLRSGYQRCPIRKCQRDALIGRNDGDIHQPGKLPYKVGLRVHQGTGVLMRVLETADLTVDTGDLRRQGIHLADRLHYVQVKIAALRLKTVCGVVEIGCQVAGCGQHALPQCQIRGVGGKLLQTVKEIADVGADAGTGAPELGLNLSQLPERSVELALLLRFLIQLNFEDRVAQALDFLQDDPGTKS